MAVSYQRFDEPIHFSDVVSCTRFNAWGKASQSLRIIMKLFFGQFGDFTDRFVERQAGEVPRGAVVDLVIDVGDVAGIFDAASAVYVSQQSEEHVKHDDRARVANMGEVVNRRPADI